jgi:hypothetical protein
MRWQASTSHARRVAAIFEVLLVPSQSGRVDDEHRVDGRVHQAMAATPSGKEPLHPLAGPLGDPDLSRSALLRLCSTESLDQHLHALNHDGWRSVLQSLRARSAPDEVEGLVARRRRLLHGLRHAPRLEGREEALPLAGVHGRV